MNMEERGSPPPALVPTGFNFYDRQAKKAICTVRRVGDYLTGITLDVTALVTSAPKCLPVSMTLTAGDVTLFSTTSFFITGLRLPLFVFIDPPVLHVQFPESANLSYTEVMGNSWVIFELSRFYRDKSTKAAIELAEWEAARPPGLYLPQCNAYVLRGVAYRASSSLGCPKLDLNGQVIRAESVPEVDEDIELPQSSWAAQFRSS